MANTVGLPRRLSRRVRRGVVRRLRPLLRPFHLVDAHTLEVRSLDHLRTALGWSREPLLEGQQLLAYRDPTDLNDRRLRDAEVIAAACANEARKLALEIGTGTGETTALMARNAPDATVYTVNVPPEEIAAAGTLTTFAPGRGEIGRAYRERGLGTVEQILANTAHWEPDFGPLDVSLVDGCHDSDFVYHDTRKVLARTRPGGIVLWHDFHPALRRVYPWIASVALGIDRLYRDGLLGGPIFHLRDSWVGLYRVPADGGGGADPC